jgi:hypothetical protein
VIDLHLLGTSDLTCLAGRFSGGELVCMKCQDAEALRRIEALGMRAVYAEGDVDVSWSGWLLFDKPCNLSMLDWEEGC